MNKIKLVIFLIIGILVLNSCGKNNNEKNDDNLDKHDCTQFEWMFPEKTKCGDFAYAEYKCIECGNVIERSEKKKEHIFEEDELQATCSENGYYHKTCQNCDYYEEVIYPATGVHSFKYEISVKATAERYGYKRPVCKMCGLKGERVAYAANGYSDHGKLSVQGADLVDEHGEKFQLVGLSTHGLQWFNRYVNYDSFDAIHNEFGINVIRLALYTAENGYCDSTESNKEFLYNKVVEGIKYATELDMYVIVDWHMVGADDVNDKNPLYYRNEAIEFFSRITKEFKDYDNILYEIMNEPNGSTTWAQCKAYANLVIPKIRENDEDAIILVGNPKWTADLNSVMASPLEGYTNIMYTYHFYANGHYSFEEVKNAYEKGFPVFISEHGGMESSGDGPIDYESIKNWYRILDTYNISYVAWNISNSNGSASILLPSNTSLTDFSDSGLKEWGIWYKAWVRNKFGLPTKKN